MAWSGQRPVEWLLDHAAVDARWCLVHATHVTPPEMTRLASSGAVAGLCPVTEANLGDGVFPSAQYLAADGAFGLGTDSNVLIAVAGELRALEYAQRLTHRARNVLARGEGRSTGRTLFDGALAGGARALGVPKWGIVEGAVADLVSFDLTNATLAGRKDDSLLDSWIFAGAPIDCVWAGGKKCVSGGTHLEGELVRNRYLRVIEGLLA